MVTQELLDYIETQTASGMDAATIRQALLTVGWDPTIIDQAMGKSISETPKTPTAAVLEVSPIIETVQVVDPLQTKDQYMEDIIEDVVAADTTAEPLQQTPIAQEPTAQPVAYLMNTTSRSVGSKEVESQDMSSTMTPKSPSKFLNILLVILILAIIAGAGYFVMKLGILDSILGSLDTEVEDTASDLDTNGILPQNETERIPNSQFDQSLLPSDVQTAPVQDVVAALPLGIPVPEFTSSNVIASQINETSQIYETTFSIVEPPADWVAKYVLYFNENGWDVRTQETTSETGINRTVISAINVNPEGSIIDSLSVVVSSDQTVTILKLNPQGLAGSAPATIPNTGS